MSVPDERPLLCGSSRALMLGTVVLATAAAAVLAAGAQDARLLRLGLVAALWAALLGAFAAARMRRELSSGAARAEELRTVYQLEMESEVAARREHTLTVERELRELREQMEQVEWREIAELRDELAAIRANLEKLTGGDPLVERVALRAEPARLLPMPTHPHKSDDSFSDASLSAVAALGATAKAPRSFTAAGSSVRAPSSTGGAVLGSPDLPGPLGEQFRADRSAKGSALPPAEWPVNGCSETVLTPREDPELRFGPGGRYRPELDTHARLPVEPAGPGDRPWNPAVSSTPAWESALVRLDEGISHAQTNGRHVAPSRQPAGSNNNGSHSNGFHSNGSHSNGSHSNGFHSNGFHSNGFHSNGGGARRAAQETPAVEAQRSVNDLLAAHGIASPSRRRRSREDGPQA